MDNRLTEYFIETWSSLDVKLRKLLVISDPETFVECIKFAEKTKYNVELTSYGYAKLAVVKAVKNTLGIGLKEAKDLVDSAPCILLRTNDAEKAKSLQKALIGAGGVIKLKS
jgi:ribosomal protein L7/L12